MVSAMNSASFSRVEGGVMADLFAGSALVQSYLPLRSLLFATTAPAAARMFLVER